MQLQRVDKLISHLRKKSTDLPRGFIGRKGFVEAVQAHQWPHDEGIKANERASQKAEKEDCPTGCIETTDKLSRVDEQVRAGQQRQKKQTAFYQLVLKVPPFVFVDSLKEG
ncbi:hypothetical protein [Spirosoma luteolum]